MEAELLKRMLTLPRWALWVLAIAFPIGLSVTFAEYLAPTRVGRYLDDLVFLLALQPALRLLGMSEANYWRFFPVTAGGAYALDLVRPPRPFPELITFIILAAVAIAGVRDLALRLRRRSSSAQDRH